MALRALGRERAAVSLSIIRCSPSILTKQEHIQSDSCGIDCICYTQHRCPLKTLPLVTGGRMFHLHNTVMIIDYMIWLNMSRYNDIEILKKLQKVEFLEDLGRTFISF